MVVIGAVLFMLVWQVGTAFGQQVHSFTQVEDQAEVCVKRGNKVRCQTFPLQPWGMDTVEVVVVDTLYLDRVVTDTIYVELPSPPPDTVIVELPPDTVVVPGPVLPPDTVIVEVPSPPDTVWMPPEPCECDTIPVPPDTIPPIPPDTTPEIPDLTILYSVSPDRSDPMPVIGETLSGTVYIFALPDSLPLDSLVWQLDAQVVQREMSPPYDYDGTAADSTANPWDTRTVANGRHSISATGHIGDYQYGRTGNFDIQNAPPDTTAAAWPLGTNPYAGSGILVYGGGGVTRVDWSVAYHPDTSPTPTGFEVLYPGGSLETDMGWVDLPVMLSLGDAVCVAPGAVGGPYDRSQEVCGTR
jgi:hypothetical protein